MKKVYLLLSILSYFGVSAVGQELSKNVKLRLEFGAEAPSIKTTYIDDILNIEVPRKEKAFRPFMSVGINLKKRIGLDVGFGLDRNVLNPQRTFIGHGELYGTINFGQFSRIIIGGAYEQFYSGRRKLANTTAPVDIFHHGFGMVIGVQHFGVNLDLTYVKFQKNTYELIGRYSIPQSGLTLRLSYNFGGIRELLQPIEQRSKN